MAEEAITLALDRMQRALDRLESAVEAKVSAPAPTVTDTRDEKLRAEVQAVIAELDRMIGGQRG